MPDAADTRLASAAAGVPATTAVSSALSQAVAPGAPATIGVLVPTFRRPDDLKRCFAALAAQRRAPDEIIVVAREDDRETWTLIEATRSRLPLRPVTVRVPGQVAALNAGLAHVRTDLIAITDDDAAPWPDWLERIVAHFASDPKVGGVGGRDHMFVGGVLQDGRATTVGKFHRLTKHVGNHHLGFGAARPVDILKGANMSYRMSAVGSRRFDTRLRGTGAQVHNDLAFSVALRHAGYTLIYDPAVAVDHFPAQRFDDDQRNTFNPVATSNAVYNETLIRVGVLEPWERAVYAVWCLFVGTRVAPGLVQWLRFLPRNPRISTARLLVSLKGRYDAFRDTLTARTALDARPGS